MRIAYLLAWDGYIEDGVVSKIREQVGQWKAHGNEVRIFLVTNRRQSIEDRVFPEHIADYFFSDTMYKTGLRSFFMHKILTVHKVKERIRKFSPDILYYRFGTYYPGIGSILKKYPTVCEINTNNESELAGRSIFLRFYHLIFRKIQFLYCNECIFMTDEIKDGFFRKNIYSTVIPNGYDVKKAESYQNKDKDPADPVRFVMSASADRPWYGLEKIFWLADNMPDCEFHIIGPAKRRCPDNMIMYGFLPNNSIHEIYRNMDIGLGMFSLYEKNMNEACSLKVREYIAYNLPVIIGNREIDIEPGDYVLQLKNTEDNIYSSLEQIKKFAEKIKTGKTDLSEIRNRIDIRVTERKRMDFFAEILKKVR